jgi:1-deoxy-D-xylulose-5-phosphate synthase
LEYQLLDKIKLPETLKELSLSQLELLASEIRDKIVTVVSKNGGHLSASMGAVELALAFHAAFKSPKDKIVWDVGHQAYAHKLLTGRLKDFESLRTWGGISGFPNRQESEYDPMTEGHASTAISQALGMAQARDLKGETFNVVAVMGDGALTGGLALEALNNAAYHKTRLIVILNDNGHSISKNVGAFSNYLTVVRTNPLYTQAKERVEKIIERVPNIGVSLVKSAEKMKDRAKHFLMDFQAGVLFEELGFRYFGPIDGHNLPILISTLKFAKDLKEPVIIHALTQKGRGYEHSEKHPIHFHGTGPFEVESGLIEKKEGMISYTEVFGNTMVALAKENEKICAITAAMPDGTGLVNFSKLYPKRFFDVGIAEGHAVAFAGGLASEGYLPVVAVYSTFLQRAYDQIFHDVCLQRLPVVFAVDRAGIVGEDGPTHNGILDLAYLLTIPTLAVAAPSSGTELKNLLYSAVTYNQPIALRYPRAASKKNGVEGDPEIIELGKGKISYKGKGAVANREEGSVKNILILAIGSMVEPSVETAKTLEADGFSVKVIDARFARPLDEKLIVAEAENHELIVTVEEGVLDGGFGAQVSKMFDEKNILVMLKKIGLPSAFIEQGGRDLVLDRNGLSSGGIYKKIKEFIDAL